MTEPTTRRGRESKARIVVAAAALMYERGVTATSVEDVLAASGTGKSQLYHYFSSKEDLVAAVLRHQLGLVLEEQNRFRLDTWEGVQGWFDTMVAMQQTSRRFLGCPLGSLAGQVTEQGERLRSEASQAFSRWEAALAHGLDGMQKRGLLSHDADPPVLAEATIATLQGGYLLTSAKRDIRPMRNAVAAARRYLESFAS